MLMVMMVRMVLLLLLLMMIQQLNVTSSVPPVDPSSVGTLEAGSGSSSENDGIHQRRSAAGRSF